MRKMIVSAALIGAFAHAPASAAIVITASPGAVQPSENVLASTNTTGPTVMGMTNQTKTPVSIVSLNGEDITSNTSNGQSRFNAVDGSFDFGQILLANGGTFTSAEFNLFGLVGDTDSVTITVNGTKTTTQTFALGNGENFFGFSATDGDMISSITFNTNGLGVGDLRQVRLGGIPSPVPEPGTWALMLLGFGMTGYSMRRRRQAALAQLA
jgi:hypothetical protein